MSDTTDAGQTPDATPTEALQLADQQPLAAAAPLAAAPVAPSSGRSHTRTILEVVGGVVAVGLILLAGVVGFAVGHATGSDRDGHWSMNSSDSRGGTQNGPDAGGPFGQGPQGLGQGQGQGMMPGQDPRGIDPDGDNWTGGQGQQGLAQPTVPQQG